MKSGILGKLMILASVLQALTLSTLTYAEMDGNSSGGGGEGYVLPSGEVLFADFHSENELPSPPLKEDQKVALLWDQDRYVKSIGEEYPEFFSSAQRVLEKWSSEFPVFAKLATALGELHPTLAEFRLQKPNSQSTREILAFYAQSKVFLSKRTLKRMPDPEQEGLSLHEAFRHLNFRNLIKAPLSDHEIEIAVRYFLNRSYPGDLVDPVLAKIKAMKDRDAERAAIDTELTRIQARLDAISKEQDLLKVGDARFQQLQSEYIQLSGQKDHLVYQSMSDMVSEIGFVIKPMENALFSSLISIELGFCKRFDVIKLETVTRCW